MSPFVQELRYANAIQHAACIEMRTGKQHKCVGVVEVNEEANAVKITNPQVHGDFTTVAWIRLGDIASVSVLDIDYPTDQYPSN